MNQGFKTLTAGSGEQEPVSTHPEDFQKITELLSPSKIGNNYTELYIDGPDTLDLLLREIRKAHHFIHVQVMLFYSDEAGMKIAKALAEKAKAGIKVRLMSDSEMSFIVRALEKFRSSGSSNFSDLEEIFSESGVQFVASDKEIYAFEDWDDKRQELKQNGVPEEFLELQDMVQKGLDSNVNVFDHRKVMIFDGETAIVTGANIGNKYLYEKFSPDEEDQGKKWHDGAVLIKGPFATTLNRHFASKWMVRGGDIFDYREHYRSKRDYGTAVCSVFSQFPGMKEDLIRNWYLDKIKTCSGKFIIQNPYINDELFWKKLSGLAPSQARKISIINPYKARGNDFPQNVSAIKCRMRQPFTKGISFYAYQHRMTHWKIALDVDKSQVFVGSYNLNHRSALHDFEMNVLVESTELSEKVLDMLKYDMNKSFQLTDADEFYENPKWHPSCFLLDLAEYFE